MAKLQEQGVGVRSVVLGAGVTAVVVVGAGMLVGRIRWLGRRLGEVVERWDAVKRMEQGTETMEWFNQFLDRYWPMYEPGLSKSIVDSLNLILEASKPNVLDDLRLTEFTLGSIAPRVRCVQTYPHTKEDHLILDMDVLFAPVDGSSISKNTSGGMVKRNSFIKLVARVGKSVASIPFPVQIKELEIVGKMRLVMRFVSNYPHIQTVDISFLQKPSIDFKLKPLGGLDVMDLPMLERTIQSTLDTALAASIIHPNKITVDLEWAMGLSDDPDKILGVLMLTLHEAEHLKNVETIGKSDPFARVLVGGNVVGATKVVDRDLSPKWEETKYIIIRRSTFGQVGSDDLVVEVHDAEGGLGKSSKLMGSTTTLSLRGWLKHLESNSTGANAISAAVQAAVTVAATGAEPRAKLPDSPANPGHEHQSSGSGRPTLSRHQTRKAFQEWGDPNPSKSTSVWRPLFLKNKPAGSVRLSMCYRPASIQDPNTEHPAGEDGNPTPEVTTGILRLRVHQAKDLSPHSPDPYLRIQINDEEPVITVPKRNTREPFFETEVTTFLQDVREARVDVRVFDKKDVVGDVALGECLVKVAEGLKRDPTDDWYTLVGGGAAKLRLSVQFTPISLSTPTPSTTNPKTTVANPVGVLLLTLQKAQNLLNRDVGGKSDPFVKLLHNGRQIYTSKVVKNCVDPVWEEEFAVVVGSVEDRVGFVVWDKDAVG
ncbi:hypothetical protein HK104_005960, partial [Borealophlyctis nickersoniae]